MEIIYLLVVGLILIILMTAIVAAKEKLDEQKHRHKMEELSILAEPKQEQEPENDYQDESTGEPTDERTDKAIAEPEEDPILYVDPKESEPVLQDNEPTVPETSFLIGLLQQIRKVQLEEEKEFSAEQENEVGVPPQKENEGIQPSQEKPEEEGESTMYMAKAQVIGRLADDPTLYQGQKEDGSDTRCTFRLMCNEPGKKADGSPMFKPDVISCIAWGNRARAIAQHCKKGKELAIEGTLKTYSAQTEEGTWTNRWEIRVESQSFGEMSQKGKAREAEAPRVAETAIPNTAPTMEMLAKLLNTPGLLDALKGQKAATNDKPF